MEIAGAGEGCRDKEEYDSCQYAGGKAEPVAAGDDIDYKKHDCSHGEGIKEGRQQVAHLHEEAYLYELASVVGVYDETEDG